MPMAIAKMTVTSHDARDALFVWHGGVLSSRCDDDVMRDSVTTAYMSQSYLCVCESPITYGTLGGICYNKADILHIDVLCRHPKTLSMATSAQS